MSCLMLYSSSNSHTFTADCSSRCGVSACKPRLKAAGAPGDSKKKFRRLEGCGIKSM